MSHENVEISLSMAGAVNRRDIAHLIDHTTEDFVLTPGRSAVEGSFVGHEGIRRFFADNAESFELFELHADDVRAVGDDRVLVIGNVHARSRGGGVELDIPYAVVATFRDGKASRWEDFRERHLALKAVGLEE
jgi:ketosteroid isomerase-like protein